MAETTKINQKEPYICKTDQILSKKWLKTVKYWLDQPNISQTNSLPNRYSTNCHQILAKWVQCKTVTNTLRQTTVLMFRNIFK